VSALFLRRIGGWRRALLQAAAGVLLLLALAAPTPGAVGSCGGEQGLDDFANLDSYCKQRDQLVCVRRQLRKELSLKETNDCRLSAIERCQLRSWSPGCHPTNRQTRACLNALRSIDTLQTKEDQLEECNTNALCTAPIVRDAGSSDAGVGR
jgi:hypothetical protein